MVSVLLVELEAKERPVGGESPLRQGAKLYLIDVPCAASGCVLVLPRGFLPYSLLWFLWGPGGEQDQLAQARSLLTTRD